MELVERIQINLERVRTTLWHSIGILLERGETAERLELAALEVAASSKTFDVETEKQYVSPWRRCCGRGRWRQWVFPCGALWHWARGKGVYSGPLPSP